MDAELRRASLASLLEMQREQELAMIENQKLFNVHPISRSNHSKDPTTARESKQQSR